jgi:hypothetical protein
VKSVPVGSVTRVLDLSVLAFWWKYRNPSQEEMDAAIAFHSKDRLDWTSGNLYSRWREGLMAEKYKNRVDPIPEPKSDIKIPTFDSKSPPKKGDEEIVRPASLVVFGETNSGMVWDKKPSKSSLVLPRLENYDPTADWVPAKSTRRTPTMDKQ